MANARGALMPSCMSGSATAAPLGHVLNADADRKRDRHAERRRIPVSPAIANSKPTLMPSGML